MVLLNAEVLYTKHLMDDTFWTWMLREFPECDHARDPVPGELVIQYSTLGTPPKGCPSIGLLWELYPEMKRVLRSNEWDHKIQKIHECARACDRLFVPSPEVANLYPEYINKIEIVPIGIDFNKFKKVDTRDYGIWVGNSHPMKGFQEISWGAANRWCIVDKGEDLKIPQFTNKQVTLYKKIYQWQVATLLSGAVFFHSSSLLKPWFLVEYEAMACDLPFEDNQDRIPFSREELKAQGWDREDLKCWWKDIISEYQ